MKKWIFILLFLGMGFNSFATNFSVYLNYLYNVNCTYYTFKAGVNGGIGPFTYSFTDDLQGALIYYSNADTVVIYPLSSIGTNVIVTVTDLSDGTQMQDIQFAGNFVSYSNLGGSPTLLINPPLPCGNGCDGILTVPPASTPAASPYLISPYPLFQWSNGSTSSQISNLCPGIYTVTIDVGNPVCPFYLTVTDTIPIPLTPTNLPHVVLDSIVNGFCSSKAYASVTGGTGAITYLWDGVAGGVVDTNLLTGNHLLTVHDASGCHDTISFNTTSISNLTLTQNVFLSCNNINDSARVNATGGIFPYTYQWNSNPIQATATATNLSPGNYQVTVIDSAGCIANNLIHIATSVPPHFFIDNFAKCSSTSLTAFVSGGISPYSFNWSNGAITYNTSIQISGTYTLTVTDSAGCNISQNVVVVSGFTNDIFGNVFNDINGNCIQDAGEPSLNNSMLIQSQPGNYFTTTDNNGFYHLVSGTGFNHITPTSLIPYFNFNCTQFYDRTFTGYCNSLNNIIFSGAFVPNIKDLEINLTSSAVRPGFGMAYYINYKNVGTVVQTGIVHLIHDTLLTMNTSAPLYSTYTSPQADFNFTNLQPQENRLITVYMNVATPQNGAVLGDSISAVASIDPIINDSTPINNSTEIYSVFTGSFDPNEKIVNPEGVLKDYDSLLTYTVWFQNTGTDTAFNVVIIDTLSKKFDLRTFKMEGYSHPLTWEIKGRSILVCTFRNIFLPDSSKNELASHGFIKYAVKLKQGLQTQSQIINTADIFFDYNTSVATNTTNNIFVSTVGLEEENANKLVEVFPIPSSGELFFKWNASLNEVNTIEIHDAISKLVLKKQTHGNLFHLQQNNITEPGIYYYSLKDKSGNKLFNGKFIIIK